MTRRRSLETRAGAKTIDGASTGIRSGGGRDQETREGSTGAHETGTETRIEDRTGGDGTTETTDTRIGGETIVTGTLRGDGQKTETDEGGMIEVHVAGRTPGHDRGRGLDTATGADRQTAIAARDAAHEI